MKVLIAEDNAVSRLTLRSSLRKWGYEVIETTNGEEAWALLSGPDAPHLAILDWMMPGLDGVQLCRRVRADGREPYVYLILLTSRDDRDDVVAGLDAGADDYIVKPWNAQELRVRVRAGERICQLQAELVAARESLRHQATHDHLTGAWNRAAILELVERERRLALRSGSPLSIAMIDFDYFKRINDQHGHLAGDLVLRQGIARILGSVRSTDMLGRYGGEEFLLVLPGCDTQALAQVGETLRAALANAPFHLADGAASVTISIGAATFAGETDCNLVVDRADRALYEAKHLGRNRVILAPIPAESAGPG